MKTASIDVPHPDFELGVQRSALRYSICAPDTGLDRNTGLIFFIAGYGMETGGDYVESLLPYLANRHNCVAASVRYFGAELAAKARLRPMPDFFVKLAERHCVTLSAPRGADIDTIFQQTMGLLAQNGITALHADCRVALIAEEYNSMGVLPALDHLQVIHRLMKEHALDRRRLYVIGTSYGGYIASLMMKFAPSTLRMVIDNSGFSSAEDDLSSAMGALRVWVGGVAIRAMALRCWSPDPTAENYLSPARREIRSLFDPRHIYANTARVYAYHAAGDRVAPLQRKLTLRDVYSGRVHYDLQIIDEASLDGRIFKVLEHGMNASIRGLFDLSYEKYVAAGGALADYTDFDLDREIRFPCSAENYIFRYSRRDGVTARRES